MKSPSAVDDPRVVSALQSSILLAALTAAVRVVWRAAARSRVTRLVAGVKQQLDSASVHERRQAVGVTLVVAAMTSLSLSAFSEQPAGWLWMAPAAIAASIGVVLLLSSTARTTK